MKNIEFIHLNIHSDYSLKDGLCHLDPLITSAQALHYPAMALTDLNNLFAGIKFYQKALKAGVKPIMGCDLEFYDEDSSKTLLQNRIILLCQNNLGYRNLIALISKAYTEGQKIWGRPAVLRSWIADYAEGLIALSGGLTGDLGQLLLKDQLAAAEQRAHEWQTIFGDRYYIEIQRIGLPREEAYIQHCIRLARQFNIPLVASNAVRFIEEKQFEAHEARVCISEGELLNDPKRKRQYTPQQYFRTVSEMKALFSDIPSALQNTVEIAKRCNLEITLGEYHLPRYPIPEGFTTESYLEHLAKIGLDKRWPAMLAQGIGEGLTRQDYDERLMRELSVINGMGYTGYFLIVADFIRWAKHNGVPVGPGRGSGPGSLVAYSIEITDLDPLKYDLLFERFLNPERVSMPDFDVDFCMEGRDRVIDYVAKTYGRESVSQIITYGTMAAKAVLRDVGRVLGYPYGFVDPLAKLVPFEIGITLEKALAQEEILRKRYEEEEDVRALIDLSLILEGSVRNAGKHAGGVVIAPSQLTDFAPLYCESGSDAWVTQYDKDDVEAVGLVKYDFLGLRTLTIIQWAVNAIHAIQKSKNEILLDITQIPLDDPKTFELLQACQTTAVFQLESRGMKDIIKRLKPDCFEEIIALVALFRPGPLQSGMVEDFIDRKHGVAEIDYPHSDLIPVLKPTYGIILYQEQVMQIAQVLANYTLGGADLLRRAMGKKKPEEMAQQRSIFIKGSQERAVPSELANSIFDLMEKFAGYGFNKSHSAAYALLSYQTAWLKAHYPAEFMAAVLTSESQDTDKLAHLIDECRQMGLQVLPPSIDFSARQFTVNDQGAIVYGLGALKGVGEGAVQAIIAARPKKNSYPSFYAFVEALDLKKVNRRVFEALINAGACNHFGIQAPDLLASLQKALALAEKKSSDIKLGQGSLFSLMAEAPEQTYLKAPAWNLRQQLQAEKESFGFYFSDSPVSAYRSELNHVIKTRLIDLHTGSKQKVVGWVSDIRTILNKRNDRMAFVKLMDETAQLEVTVFADLYQEFRNLLQKDKVLIIEGDLSLDDWSGALRMNAKKILSINDYRLSHARYLRLDLKAEECSSPKITALKEIFARHRQEQLESLRTCPLYFHFSTQTAEALLSVDQQFKVLPSDELLDELGQQASVELVY